VGSEAEGSELLGAAGEQWPVASEDEAGEIAVIEKPQVRHQSLFGH
jgi:hypothetical protein